MIRTTFCLWPYWWRATIPVCIPFMLLIFPEALGTSLIAFSVVAIRYYLAWRSGRPLAWLWHLTRRVKRFHTLNYRNIVLHYEPALERRCDISAFLRCCKVELDRLTTHFGRPLRGRVVVYYFARHEDIGSIFGHGYGGWALWHSNAIVVADDNYLLESVRHEFGHLFSNRLNPNLPPPLFSEGLCVWLQQTEWGLPIDTAVRRLLKDRKLTLPLMLNPKFFFDEANRITCYAISGSFSGFLIRRHGWQTFCSFFRTSHRLRFKRTFKKSFGVSLEKAEWQWRSELAVMEILNRRLGRSLAS